ncbi:MAG TPA: FkbM family methyltransferase [Smithellaceae bacterium]|nr:FkbM family methyltransferase [Smithellaceae bacterium]
MTMSLFFKNAIKNILPPKYINKLIDFYHIKNLPKHGLSVKQYDQYFDIVSDSGKCIRISRKHNIYMADILASFDYYYTAVEPVEIDGRRLVDYSRPSYHDVIGYDLHPIMFSSFAEPIATTNQYVDFARLTDGSIVLDLGAYSGLTSIMFDRIVGPKGRVIAVDPDPTNIKSMSKNFGNYQRATGRKIDFLEGAVWEHNSGIMFSGEGNMGSSASTYVGEYRGNVKKVKTFTLSAIALQFGLQAVDFIKCDIEGAESVIFRDSEFFKKNKPRIIIEPHYINGILTTGACIDQLSPFGYKFNEIKQHGSHIPLLECYPISN